MTLIDRSAILVRHKQPYLDWAAGIDEEAQSLVDTLRGQTTVYLVEEMEPDRAESELVKRHFEEIFEAELDAWHQDSAQWPSGRDLELFRDWFRIEFHSMVFDLSGAELEEDEY